MTFKHAVSAGLGAPARLCPGNENPFQIEETANDFGDTCSANSIQNHITPPNTSARSSSASIYFHFIRLAAWIAVAFKGVA